jgi:very-short-patch-repair endonuclease
LATKTHAKNIVGGAYTGQGSSLVPLKASLRFADAIATESLPAQAVRWILGAEYSIRLTQLRDWLGSAGRLAADFTSARGAIRAITASNQWFDDEKAQLDAALPDLERALNHSETLADWQHYLRIKEQSSSAHLTKLTALADEGHIEGAHLVPAFRFLLYHTLAKRAFDENTDLVTFSGTTLEETRKQFAATDRQIIELQRLRIASVVDRRSIPVGKHTGPVKSWTEQSLINNEISKQKRHLPIRQLVHRAGAALQAMKPCFMMGPLSVAQYLDPRKLAFDLVVMDEASQLRPEDALGAVARGGQLVVVGDPKQLPPTNFFQRVALEEDDLNDDEELTAIEESESILDVASVLFQPIRRLRWHYRSRHHSLIAFSNREFYDGDLIVFPSAHHESPELGIKYHRVAAGSFVERRNFTEASVVVDAIVNHIERRPHESLGVVALNFEQRELIEDLLDQRLRTEVFAPILRERSNEREPLFIKNLENVQGDERDVIFISTTYGPDAKGNQFQRFGPINGPNGHRRLNVLFTRARKRTEVFSSLDPDKLLVNDNSARGLRALKQYLQYARTGILESGDDSTGEPVNDFERSVGNVLKHRGFQVACQVGVAGFFVDLAIRHPGRPGTYLLGVECDGASYHSGRSARDRDRLRQEILESQGWTIHRIWSTDWFNSRAAEVSRLSRRIDELLDAGPEYVQSKLAQQTRERLLQEMKKLIDEIDAEFPNTDPATRLLRPALLDLLIQKRPRNKSDWFRVIPEPMRSTTDLKQISSFLPRVLDLIANMTE